MIHSHRFFARFDPIIWWKKNPIVGIARAGYTYLNPLLIGMHCVDLLFSSTSRLSAAILLVSVYFLTY